MTRLYEPAAGLVVLPLGLPTMLALEAPDFNGGQPLRLLTRSMQAGVVVGFVCLTPGLTVLELNVGKNLMLPGRNGFPSEAAQGDPRVDATGLALPRTNLEISQDVSALVSNAEGRAAIVRAYFLLELPE